jgi:GH25 family lysozyme M1 (1,4-beta-N-acetylmuramidase)
MLTGPDISTFQPDATIHWPTVRAHNAFVFYRAIFNHTPDDELSAHRENARQQDFLLTGAYAFLRAGDPAAQAHAYLSLLGEILPNEVLVLDAESYEGWGPGVAEVVAWASAVREGQPNVARLLYCSWSYWTDVLAADPSIVELFDGLWIAAYGQTSPFGDVAGAQFWQFTDGTVPSPCETPGIGPCDCSYFAGTEDDLRALAALRKDIDMFTEDDRNMLTYVSQLLTELKGGFAEIDPNHDWFKGLSAFAESQRVAREAVPASQ